MKRTELLKLPPIEPGDLSPTGKRVLARSCIHEIDGEQVLEIDLYYHAELKARYFADEQNHYAWSDGKWSTRTLDNTALVSMGERPVTGEWYYYGTDHYDWASGEDEDRAERYLGCPVETYEYRLTSGKSYKAYERKKEKIRYEMEQVPALPDEVDEWVEREIFPENYLFITKTKKGCNYSCTACGSRSWRRRRWKRGERTVCPKCGAGVIVKPWKDETTIARKETVVVLQRYTRTQKQKSITRKKNTIILQNIIRRAFMPSEEEVWIERQFQAVCIWEQASKKIRLLEEIRAVIPDQCTYGTVYYGTEPAADESEQEFWDKNSYNRRFKSAYLYPGNLQEVLPECMKRSGIIEMASQKFPVNKYIISSQKRPWLEYLVKAGLKNLASELVDAYTWGGSWCTPDEINTCGRNLSEALKLDGNRTHRMKQINGKTCALRWLQYEQRMEDEGEQIRISQESLEFLNAKRIGPDDCSRVLADIGSVNRMVNYIKKQKTTPQKTISTWRDYLIMARNEGLDTSDDIVRFPKDLVARHNQLVAQINQRTDAERARKAEEKHRELDEMIKANLPDVRKYFYEDDTYMIIPAGKCQELIEEGRALHHCVGSSDYYMTRMAKGESWILFLRKKAELEKPWYTIEIQLENDHIMQYYSEFDRKPDLEIVNAVLKKFKNSIRNKTVRAA